MKIDINYCDKHSLSLQDILYQIPVLLSGIIAELLRSDCNWDSLGKCRETGLNLFLFLTVWRNTHSSQQILMKHFYSKTAWESMPVLTQDMGQLTQLRLLDWKGWPIFARSIRAGWIAQLCFPKGWGGTWADEVRLAFRCATSNTTLTMSKVLPADVMKVLLTSWQILLSWERPNEFMPLFILSELQVPCCL